MKYVTKSTNNKKLNISKSGYVAVYAAILLSALSFWAYILYQASQLDYTLPRLY